MAIDLRGAMVGRVREAQDRSMTRTWLIPLVLLVAACGATTPVQTARQVTSARAGWGAPEQASVAAVRRIVVTTRGPSARAIAHCQAHAGGSRAAYIRCALPTLAQLGSSGEMNAMILLRLSGATRPSSACLALIHSLAGAEGTL